MNGIEPGGPDAPLSYQRQKILRFVRKFTQREGYPPTLREIGMAVGLAPPQSITTCRYCKTPGTSRAGRDGHARPWRRPGRPPGAGLLMG
jgi:hypothetical protein